MGILSGVRSIYTLNTLDARLVESDGHSSSPPKNSGLPSITGTAGESSETTRTRESAPRSRWRTPEFFVYYGVFAYSLPLMFKAAWDVSQPEHPIHHTYKHLLSSGWLFGRKVDNSDLQYSFFRNNVPTLTGVLFLHFVLRRVFNYVYTRCSPTPPASSSYRATHNINRRKLFDVLFAAVFLFILHGFSIIKIFVILLVNFLISYFHPSSIAVPILTWVFNIGVIFANDRYRGYRFQEILPWLIAGEGQGVGYAMDAFMRGGIVARWEVTFNFTILRLISYNLDHYWAARQLESGESEEGSVLEVGPLSAPEHERPSFEDLESARLMEFQKKQNDPANISERDRIKGPAPIGDYGLLNYIAYTLYTPLYLAGPIMTFNDFTHQQKYTAPTHSPRRTFLYAIRFLISLFSMEVTLHLLYVVAISKIRVFTSLTPFQLLMVGYFNLHIIWLKLLLPWRFFRLWSLTDAIDPPENMLRCMSNNYSAVAFWRAWHRSFNRWTIRYIYIPLDGARYPIRNMIVVFTFVALWHDVSLKLLTWGWLIVLFVAPEIVAQKIFTAKRFEGREGQYRVLCTLGGVANMFMMFMANLVGFALGVDGVKALMKEIFGSTVGLVTILMSGWSVFTAVMIMREIRMGEKRKGIDLRC